MTSPALRTPPVFRFAPSPNGYLHLGHAFSALSNFDAARRGGGRFLLRMEDIDPARCRPDFEQAIEEDLSWLGLQWEQPVRRQSEHLDAYAGALATLRAQGLLYAAFESRAQIARLVALREKKGVWPRDPDGAPLYPGKSDSLSAAEQARRIAAGEPYVLRLDMTKACALAGSLSWTETGAGPDGEQGAIVARPQAWGDVVLARKEIPTSYHLSVVVDDAVQGVTHVMRGQDLFWATSVHRLLQTLLGLPAPLYHHHRLILDDDGKKLAKSNSSTALRALRTGGMTPAGIRKRFGLPAS